MALFKGNEQLGNLKTGLFWIQHSCPYLTCHPLVYIQSQQTHCKDCLPFMTDNDTEVQAYYYLFTFYHLSQNAFHLKNFDLYSQVTSKFNAMLGIF